jgi:hypothetical protein
MSKHTQKWTTKLGTPERCAEVVNYSIASGKPNGWYAAVSLTVATNDDEWAVIRPLIADQRKAARLAAIRGGDA